MGFHNDPRRHSRRFNHGEAGGPLRPIFHNETTDPKPDYKTTALCKQVRRILSLALAGACGDPILQELIVDEVLPAPNAGHLLVHVLLRPRQDGPTPVDVLIRLDRVHGLLRAQIAEGIARKRTPELSFNVLPITAAPASEEQPHD